MKGIYKISLILISALTVFTSCFRNEEETFDNAAAVQLKVVSSNILFEAAPSTGTIEVQASGTVTATTEATWCQTEVNGNTITVTVPENGDLNGRSALITITCGSETTNVTCQQKGLRFELSAGSEIKTNLDKAQKFTYALSTNVNLTFSSSEDWFTYEVNGDSLSVNLTENTTGHIRMGYIHYDSDTYSDSIKVVQYEPSKDIQGSAYLYYYNSSGSLYRTALNITEDELQPTSYYNAYGWTLGYTLDEDDLQFVVQNAQKVGTYSSYYVYNIVLGGGYLTTSTSVKYTAPIDYYEEDGLYEADFTTTWSYGLQRIALYAMKTDSPTGSRVSALVSWYYPAIIRFNP